MVGCGKLLPFLIFAGNTFVFCWNQFLDLLQQERIMLGAMTAGVPCFLLHMIFAGTIIKFCWNRQIYLLQPSTGGFCCIRFLLEIASSFAGTS